MKEIGGYFGLEQLKSQEWYDGLVAVNSARNALLYLLKARDIKKVYIPYYLCDTVYMVCQKYGYEYEYYHIDEDFLPVFKKTLEEKEYLYVVNFYGQISNETIFLLKEKYGNIIVDNVQAFFQKPIENIDTIYSCRKFFGVPDGAYLSTTAMLNEALNVDASKDRMVHILGRYEGVASDFYQYFQENDESFYELELRHMSKLTHNILGAVDYEHVRKQRNDNYAILEKYLGQLNGKKFIMPEGPYCYPLYCRNGMVIKKYLAQKKIYVATLWPNVLEVGETLEKDYAENILPLPCDQRYSEDDMLRIVEEIRKCIS